MSLAFVKYEGAGNDFILIDNRGGIWQDFVASSKASEGSEKSLIARLCHPKFGIGADGLMLLQDKEGYDFEMVYFNSDGGKSSMCGNGGRCIAAWAFSLGIGELEGSVHFWAPDGAHSAMHLPKSTNPTTLSTEWISLSMNDVESVQALDDQCYELNTGSPHFVSIKSENIHEIDLVAWARGIRYNADYAAAGINVNAVNIIDDTHIAMRTYERGVEGETLSCGTGVTAAALSLATMKSLGGGLIHVSTRGGDLSVAFSRSPSGFCNIRLQGPTRMVFSGIL
ncbi:MAG: diaminopimelate epimerase [Bacteroidetes bacterium]|nr:diaminopimelate epimerase [Bacteroidota bacterium]